VQTVDTCTCQGCQALRSRYRNDLKLLAFYSVQLAKRGWAGSTDEVEQAYMLAHAPWYGAAQERGRRAAARTGWGKRVAETGEAQTPPAEESRQPDATGAAGAGGRQPLRRRKGTGGAPHTPVAEGPAPPCGSHTGPSAKIYTPAGIARGKPRHS